jgi:hypothetical protein
VSLHSALLYALHFNVTCATDTRAQRVAYRPQSQGPRLSRNHYAADALRSPFHFMSDNFVISFHVAGESSAICVRLHCPRSRHVRITIRTPASAAESLHL